MPFCWVHILHFYTYLANSIKSVQLFPQCLPLWRSSLSLSCSQSSPSCGSFNPANDSWKRSCETCGRRKSGSGKRSSRACRGRTGRSRVSTQVEENQVFEYYNIFLKTTLGLNRCERRWRRSSGLNSFGHSR